MLTKDEAICIRTVDYSETSQVVTFFGRTSGKLSAIAKGSKRPKSAFEGPVEVLAHGAIVFSDSNRERLATLTEFSQQSHFRNLSGNLYALNCCLLGAELVGSLTDEYDPHPTLFESFLQFLRDAGSLKAGDNSNKDVLAMLVAFELTLLREIGLQPVLNACANCKTAYRTEWTQCHFSSTSNGLICRDCEGSFSEKVRLSRAAADCLAELKTILRASRDTLKEVERVLIYHFTGLLHKRPRMADYVLHC